MNPSRFLKGSALILFCSNFQKIEYFDDLPFSSIENARFEGEMQSN